jgi:hypothetical protein
MDRGEEADLSATLRSGRDDRFVVVREKSKSNSNDNDRSRSPAGMTSKKGNDNGKGNDNKDRCNRAPLPCRRCR